ncbi:MAG: bacillithiol biosynthesis deacetylase BshB1, partial [Acidobacteria bacterium]|nr:bacillithiol biosynthesis deacetylase BshB1 [Acidobacteriota bacterium]
VVTEAVFNAGLRRYDIAGDAWRTEWVCYYFINDNVTPSFLINVSADYDVKRKALAAHRTQFEPADAGSVATRLTSPRFMQLIESRDAHFGALAGVAFAEGFIVKEPILRCDLFR